MRLPPIRADLEGVFQAHRAETACAHIEHELRRKVAANGATTFAFQCIRCGAHVGSAKRATLSDAQIRAAPEWDARLKENYWRQHSDRYSELRRKADQDAYEKWLRQYNAYLETPEWKQKRKLVLLRAQGTCEGCRLAPATEVHHLVYTHVGEEFLFELAAVCGPCHKRLHADMLESLAPPKT